MNWKNKITFIFVLTAFYACSTKPKKNKQPTTKKTTKYTYASHIPETMKQVFEAHGGAANWQQQRSMVFSIPKDSTKQKHILDLKTRQERIEAPNYTMGNYNGSLWITTQDTTMLKRARFYNNLMFYFYAMPQVLLDKGVQFEAIDPLDIENTSYPGFRVNFSEGTGDSDGDEYLLYYHPETHQLRWLAYTVTYFSKQASKKYNWILYDTYQTTNGVVLPKQISWVKTKEALPTLEIRNTVFFELNQLTETKPDSNIFKKPTNALLVP